MAVEFTWIYGPMKVAKLNGFNDVVTEVGWTCTAKDPSRSETITGMDSGAFLVPEADPANYILLSNLTDSNVAAWIDASFDKTTIEARVSEILEGQLSPPIYFVDVPAGVNPVVQEVPISPPPMPPTQ